jgi:hypothetical protein
MPRPIARDTRAGATPIDRASWFMVVRCDMRIAPFLAGTVPWVRIPPLRQPSLGAKRKAKGCHAGVKGRRALVDERLRCRSKATAWLAA